MTLIQTYTERAKVNSNLHTRLNSASMKEISLAYTDIVNLSNRMEGSVVELSGCDQSARREEKKKLGPKMRKVTKEHISTLHNMT
jgi:hypothetical protein